MFLQDIARETWIVAKAQSCPSLATRRSCWVRLNTVDSPMSIFREKRPESPVRDGVVCEHERGVVFGHDAPLASITLQMKLLRTDDEQNAFTSR